MGIFGWSLPPGCSTLPGEEASALSLSHLLTLTPGVLDVFWDEDGNLLESYAMQFPEDAIAGIPAHSECAERSVGHIDWNDDLTDAQNLAAAAKAYQVLIEQTAQGSVAARGGHVSDLCGPQSGRIGAPS